VNWVLVESYVRLASYGATPSKNPILKLAHRLTPAPTSTPYSISVQHKRPMRNFNQLSLEQINQEIERLQQQLLSVEDQISDLQKKNWSNYKGELKNNLLQEIEKTSCNLKPKTAFRVVCEKYFSKELSNQIFICFNICKKTNNWRSLQSIYSRIDSPSDREKISFFATLYRKNVLKEKNIYITNLDKSKYQEVLADFEQTNAFN